MKTKLHYLFFGLALLQSSIRRMRWLGCSLRFVCTLGCLYLTSQVVVFGQLITFDDLPSNQARVPNGYGGLIWSNFDYLNVSSYGLNPSGYQAGMISPSRVGFGFPASSPTSVFSVDLFNLDSAHLTAAWNDNLQLEVKGYAGTTLIYDNSYILSAISPTLIQFGYLNVNEVDFLSSGGTHHSGYPGSGQQFVIDNLVIDVPEPSILALVLLGALCITEQILKSQKRPDSRLG